MEAAELLAPPRCAEHLLPREGAQTPVQFPRSTQGTSLQLPWEFSLGLSDSGLDWREVKDDQEPWVSSTAICGSALGNAPNPGQTRPAHGNEGLRSVWQAVGTGTPNPAPSREVLLRERSWPGVFCAGRPHLHQGDDHARPVNQDSVSFLSTALKTPVVSQITENIPMSGKLRSGVGCSKTRSSVHCLAVTAHPDCAVFYSTALATIFMELF